MSFQWTEQDVKDNNYKDFVVKMLFLRRYYSFNGLFVLYPLELLMSTKKPQKLTMLFHSQVTENSCTGIMSAAEALAKVLCQNSPVQG